MGINDAPINDSPDKVTATSPNAPTNTLANLDPPTSANIKEPGLLANLNADQVKPSQINDKTPRAMDEPESKMEEKRNDLLETNNDE